MRRVNKTNFHFARKKFVFLSLFDKIKSKQCRQTRRLSASHLVLMVSCLLHYSAGFKHEKTSHL